MKSVGRLRACADGIFSVLAKMLEPKLSFFLLLQLTIFYSIVNNNKQSTFTLLCSRDFLSFIDFVKLLNFFEDKTLEKYASNKESQSADTIFYASLRQKYFIK